MAEMSTGRKRKNRPCGAGGKVMKKRRETLVKKAWELETLCAAKVCILSCCDSDGGGGGVDQVWPKDENNKARALIMAHKSDQAQPSNKPTPNLPEDCTAQLWRQLEAKRRAVEEKIEYLDGKSVIMCTTNQLGEDTSTNGGATLILLGHENVENDESTTMLSNGVSGDAEPWSWEELMEVGDRDFSFGPAGNFGANHLTEFDEDVGCSVGETMLDSAKCTSGNTSSGIENSKWEMPVLVMDQAADFEAADNLAAASGFENWAENNNTNNIESIIPSSESLRYDLYLLCQGTNVSMYDDSGDDDMGFQHCTADQPFISPLHEALPMSFWPQPSQLGL